MKFSAPTDIVVKVVSNAAIILALLLLYDYLYQNSYIGLTGLIILMCVLLSAWCYHPQYYLLEEDCLKIKRPVGSITIPYHEIYTAGTITKSDLGSHFRLFACGGLFGYFGLYTSKNMGRFYMWCTNKDNMIAMITSNDKIIVISPSDAEACAHAINDKLRPQHK